MMGILHEQIVEEWLNQQGYFTIRGVKKGNNEIDFLALKIENGEPQGLHVEVHVSFKPIGNICRPKGKTLKDIKAATDSDLEQNVKSFVYKKYEVLSDLRKSLCNCDWKYMFVVHKFNNDREIAEISKQGIQIKHFADVLKELKLDSQNKLARKFRTYNTDLVDLIGIMDSNGN